MSEGCARMKSAEWKSTTGKLKHFAIFVLINKLDENNVLTVKILEPAVLVL